MSEHVESIKTVAEYLRDLAKMNEGKETLVARLQGYANRLDAAEQEIVRLLGLTTALPPDLGNIHDLPTVLLEELTVAKGDEIDDQIVTVINAYGGTASLDQILVGLYRKFGVVQKRRFLQNKLYRMTMVWGVGGKKGVYTTTEPVEEESEENPRHYQPPSGGDMDDEIPF